MAFFNLAVIVVFISMANAQGFWNQNQWGQMRMPRRFAPVFPTPPFLPFLPFPPSAIHVPSVEDMTRIQPGPNQFFDGVAVRMSSSYSKDAQGNVIRTGGSTMVTNRGGKIDIVTVGNNAPKVNGVPPTAGQN